MSEIKPMPLVGKRYAPLGSPTDQFQYALREGDLLKAEFLLQNREIDIQAVCRLGNALVEPAVVALAQGFPKAVESAGHASTVERSAPLWDLLEERGLAFQHPGTAPTRLDRAHWAQYQGALISYMLERGFTGRTELPVLFNRMQLTPEVATAILLECESANRESVQQALEIVTDVARSAAAQEVMTSVKSKPRNSRKPSL